MTFHKTALFLWLLGCLLTSCAKNVSLPVSTSTLMPEATTSPLVSQSPAQAIPPSQIENSIAISPDGSYVIACQFPELVLFDVRDGTAVSRLHLGYSACQRNIRWSPDSLSAILIDQQGTLYQWRVDGSQPAEVDAKIDIPSSRHTGHTKVITAWSPDGKYLAIFRECNTYITQPFGGTLLQNPLKVGEGCVVGIQWATNNVLMVDIWSEYRFYQIPAGTYLGHWSKIEGCIEQIPTISPDQRWMIFHQCDTSPHFNQAPNDQYTIANLEQGSVRVFSGMAGNYIDFIGWKDDGAAFYFISGSASPDSSPDPRTPFGLLVLDPNTAEITNLFEQAWFAAFNKDLSWAFVVFPAANADGTLRLDGGLWEVGTSEIKSKQVMDSSEGIRINGNRDFIFLSHLALQNPTGVLLSATGQYLGGGGSFSRLVPAAWSSDNSRVALINADRQLVIIDLQGNVQVVTRLEGAGAGIYGNLAWSHDDKLIILGEKTFPVP
jgi:WD40 repeat protein